MRGLPPGSGSAPSDASPRSDGEASTGSATTTRWLLLGGTVGPVLLVVGVVAAGLAWPGFEHRVQNISDLGGTEAPRPLILNATLIVVGMVVLTFSIGLRRAMPSTPALGPVLVGVFGASLAIQGVTPCTPGCGAGTTTDLVHVAAALLGIVAIGVAAILTAVRGRRTLDSHRRRSWVCGVAVWGLLGAWLVAGSMDPDRWHAGVYQRLLLIAVLTWLVSTWLAGRAAVAARSARPRR